MIKVVAVNQSAYLHAGSLHRHENIGAGALETIEVQPGDYLGEDTIERLVDDFGRELFVS